MTDELLKISPSITQIDHWSQQSQKWNGMCADCHVTNFSKNYNIKTDSFNSQFAEINVSCEACHGPASGHEQWLTQRDPKVRFKGFNKSFDALTPHKIVDQCARCHSRHSSLSNNIHDSNSLYDHMVAALPTPPAYYIDGQVKDEDFVYSSYLQSKMYANHVSCIACHDSHSNQLRVEGNGVCTQCHLKEKYADVKHHKHKSPQATNCLNCHMTGKMYMSRDFRRDHSFRIPRPDLTKKFSTPNACSSCHSEKNIDWVVSSFNRLFKKPDTHFADVIAAADQGIPTAENSLIELVEGDNKIVASVALQTLSRAFPRGAVKLGSTLFKNKDDMLRHEAVSSIPVTEDNIHQFLAALEDSRRAIRSQAAFKLSSYEKMIPSASKTAYDKALDEYTETMNFNYDFPQSKMNWAILEYNRGHLEKAAKHLLMVQKQDKLFLDAYVYLGYIYNQMGKTEEALAQFKTYLKHNPYDSQRLFEISLLYAETKRYQEAEGSMQKAVALDPNNANFMLNLAKLQEINKRFDEAEKMFEKIIDQNPSQKSFYIEFINFYTRTKQGSKANSLKVRTSRQFGQLR